MKFMYLTAKDHAKLIKNYRCDIDFKKLLVKLIRKTFDRFRWFFVECFNKN